MHAIPKFQAKSLMYRRTPDARAAILSWNETVPTFSTDLMSAQIWYSDNSTRI